MGRALNKEKGGKKRDEGLKDKGIKRGLKKGKREERKGQKGELGKGGYIRGLRKGKKEEEKRSPSGELYK